MNGEEYLFYATFIPGLQDYIAGVIKERLSDAKIHKLLEGAVLFETGTSYDKLNFFCFNNIFAVINVLEEVHTKTRRFTGRAENGERGINIIEDHINIIIKNQSAVNFNLVIRNCRKFNTFRVVASCENAPAAINSKLRADVEKYLSRKSGLNVNRSLPDTEFWFLYRSEGFSLFMKRLTLRSSWEKTLHKGELPPPLAWTLCRLAGLKHTDTVLDPFCGYGSIPGAALKHFHINNFIACDNNRKAAAFTINRFKNRKTENFIFYNADFSELPSFIKEKSVDAVVTDPPWGMFKEAKDSFFAEKMFDVFLRLLKDGGRAVVLYANDGSLQKAVPSCFETQASIPILLSGKKAVIYLLKK
ncbi:MAG: methyltransferase [Treponema sp.]|nr:methyltransferase [Treponema sp.]